MFARVFILIPMLLAMTGCAPRATTPFHIYGSTLLRAKDYDRARQSSRELAANTARVPIRDVYELPSKRAIAQRRTKPARKRATPRRRPRQATPKPHTSTPSLATRARQPSATNNPTTRAGQRADAAAQYVWETLAKNDVELRRDAKFHIPKLYRACKKTGKMHFTSNALVPGAIVFFHNTYDANQDRRNNDWYTHAALVTARDGNNITLSAYQHAGVQSFRMNLKTPKDTRTNAQLRPRDAQDIPYTQYYAGELFAGACHPKGMKPLKTLLTSWAP